MTDAWSLPTINGTMGDTPEQVLEYCDSGNVDWSNWAMRDMRGWLREVRDYESRVKTALGNVSAQEQPGKDTRP